MAGHVGPHCEKVSHGCDNCYACSNNGRCLPSNGTGLPFDRRSRDLVEAFLDEKALQQPLMWKLPKKIFVENQSDLFGEWVTGEMIDRVFAVAEACPWHKVQFLTKRASRMCQYFRDLADDTNTPPYLHMWLGFSAEDQATFDERWAYMRRLGAAGWLVWCSYEPALGPVDMRQALKEGLRWVVVGGESGSGARPCDIGWIQSIVGQCKKAGVACFVKQLGANPMYPRDTVLHPPQSRIFKPKSRKGGDPSEWPKSIRVLRQFPEARV